MPLISQKKCSWLVISDRTSSLHKALAKEAPTLCVELGQVATKSLIANDGGAIRLAGTLQ